MNRPNIFKIAIVSAAFAGLAITGAGTALADVPRVDSAPAFFPFVDFEDVFEQPFENFGDRTERNFENFGDGIERQFEVFD
ncbi:hypothetical protein [Mycolicibacterium tusciae]|uniref:hypothetical protein n=1 Tax=Mycolicibacterium tusciae TaxID=75922 RepID=UPI00024A12B7|nr:hypothetical protein [Mycolicibacterium tusciae]